MVTDAQAEQMRRDVLVQGARGPVLVRYLTDLLHDRQERVEREARLREGLRAVYRRLRQTTALLCEQGRSLTGGATDRRPYAGGTRAGAR
jgi:hypothetical protein